MKNRIKKISVSLLITTMCICISCTKDFLETNTDPNAATEKELGYDNLGLGSLITQMEYQIYPCITKDQNIDVNNYQKMFNLAGDIYSGHQGTSNMFENNGRNNSTYSMTPNWYSIAYTTAYQNYMTPWYNLVLKKEISPSAFAVGQIIKVFAMHRITDMYGPLPYKDFVPATNVPFTSQDIIYETFFDELDEAIKLLEEFIKDNPNAKPLAEYDNIYNGDFNKWIKFANSIKLRLAIRIVYADPEKAKIKAEEAISNGTFITNEDNAMIHVNGSSTVNPLYMICNTYNDTRLGATFESYLKGYNDPRIDALFLKSEISENKDFNGIRTGISFNGNEYKVFSKLNVSSKTPIQLMTAAEVYFLKAEAALRNWDVKGVKAKTLYEEGVKTAFKQPLGANGTKIGDATNYLNGTTLPITYKDPLKSIYNYQETGQTCVKWDENANQEELLEKIITQKWIALYPDGQEAWSEFRRTGFPRVIPVKYNYSGGYVDTKKQIARIPYPNNLKNDYPELYLEAIKILNGADNAGTKLWWDKKNNKRYQ